MENLLMTEKHDYKRFKPSEIARSFPATAETLLMDTYLTNGHSFLPAFLFLRDSPSLSLVQKDASHVTTFHFVVEPLTNGRKLRILASRSLRAKLDCNPSGDIAPNPNFFTTFDGMRSQQIRLVGGDASLNVLRPVSAVWPWLAVAGLGAYHGLDPSMGWLFAVALGLHERSLARVVCALGPLTLGHLLSIAAVVAFVVGLSAVIAINYVRPWARRSSSYLEYSAISGRGRIRDGSQCA
jgi:hypothetical protein